MSNETSFNPSELEAMQSAAQETHKQSEEKAPDAEVPSVRGSTQMQTQVEKPLDGAMDPDDLGFNHIFLMQPLSSFVKEGGTQDDIQPGDLVTDDEDILAKKGEELFVIPLFHRKFFSVCDANSNPPKVIGAMDFVGNERRDRFEMYKTSEGVKKIENKLIFNFFVILLKDLEGDMIFPYSLRLKGSNISLAKKMCSHMDICKSAKTYLVAGLRSELVNKSIDGQMTKYYAFRYKRKSGEFAIKDPKVVEKLKAAYKTCALAARQPIEYSLEKKYTEIEGNVPSFM